MKQKLKDIIISKSLKFGRFNMAAGGVSNILVDLSTALRTISAQTTLESLIQELELPSINNVGGPLCGSDLIAPIVAKVKSLDGWFGVRKEPKGRGLDYQRLTGNFKAGDKVLMVEDVTTTGKSLSTAIHEAKNAGLNVVGALSVVDRGGLRNIEREFSIPTFKILSLDEIISVDSIMLELVDRLAIRGFTHIKVSQLKEGALVSVKDCVGESHLISYYPNSPSHLFILLLQGSVFPASSVEEIIAKLNEQFNNPIYSRGAQ